MDDFLCFWIRCRFFLFILPLEINCMISENKAGIYFFIVNSSIYKNKDKDYRPP